MQLKYSPRFYNFLRIREIVKLRKFKADNDMKTKG